jgi:lipoprotein NlpD
MGATAHRGARILVIIGSGATLAACIPQGAGPRAVVPRYAASAPPTPAPSRDADRVRELPAPPPAWEARRASADGRVVPTTRYTVQHGDTLRRIAERTGAGSEAIARANAMVAPFVVHPGQQLTIPGGRYHLVRAGETGIAIARAYGVPWAQVVAANALTDPYILRTGQRILIPGDAAPTAYASASPSNAATRAARFTLDIEDIVTGGEPAIAANAAPARAQPTPARPLASTAAVAAPPPVRGGYQWPATGTILARFGKGQSGERNDGIKIAVPVGTPVLAANDGVVIYAGSEVPALGGLVMLRHSTGLITVYGHASELLVQRGQTVKRGQAVALSGDSGFAPRPQLHFEMRQGRDPIDPLTRLPTRT